MKLDDTYLRKSYEVSKIIEKYINEYSYSKKSLQILDFGCGFGELSYGLKNLYPDAFVLGVDIMPDVLWAKKNIKNIEFLKILPGEKLSLKEKKFDVIVSWSCIEHVNQKILDKILGDLYDILNNKGIFILQISPLFYSARGAHLWGEVFDPWRHLFEQEDLLLYKIKNFFKGSSKSTISTYKTLNKIIHFDLKKKLNNIGFLFEHEYYTEDPEIKMLPENLRKVYKYDVLKTNQLLYVIRKQIK